jgi:hypothetical protein
MPDATKHIKVHILTVKAEELRIIFQYLKRVDINNPSEMKARN